MLAAAESSPHSCAIRTLLRDIARGSDRGHGVNRRTLRRQAMIGALDRCMCSSKMGRACPCRCCASGSNFAAASGSRWPGNVNRNIRLPWHAPRDPFLPPLTDPGDADLPRRPIARAGGWMQRHGRSRSSAPAEDPNGMPEPCVGRRRFDHAHRAFRLLEVFN